MFINLLLFTRKYINIFTLLILISTNFFYFENKYYNFYLCKLVNIRKIVGKIE